jgi:hypothetical protein
LLVLCLGLAAEPRPAAAGAGVGGILPAFNQICSELQAGREALRGGGLTDEAFGDLLLDLFVRADSLSALMGQRLVPSRAYTPAAALSRALRCLKVSLRENYEGLIGRDGYRFVKADLELKAALAWRSGVTGAETGTP